jgi:hypothetical protein
MLTIDIAASRNAEKVNILLQEDGVIAAPSSLRGRTLFDLIRDGYTLTLLRPGETSSGRLGTL